MKTAGTAINYAFFSSVGADPEAVYSILNRKGSYSVNGVNFTRKVSLIKSGNFTYGFSHEPTHKLTISKSHYTFTCLRDPFSRVLSIWNALLTEKARGNKRPGHKWLGRSFSDFLSKIPITVLNGHLWMFSRNLSVEEALKNISKCNMVIFFEDLNKGVGQLSQATGWSLNLSRVNVSEFSEEISIGDKKILLSKLKKEYDFYNRTREKVMNVG